MDRRSFIKGALAGGALAVAVPRIFQVPLGAPVGFARNHPYNKVWLGHQGLWTVGPDLCGEVVAYNTQEEIDQLTAYARRVRDEAGEFVRATLDGKPSLRRVGKFWVSDDITRQVDEQLLDMDFAKLAFRNGGEIDIQIRPLSPNHQNVMKLADELGMSPRFQEGLHATLVGTEEQNRVIDEAVGIYEQSESARVIREQYRKLGAGDGGQEKATTL